MWDSSDLNSVVHFDWFSSDNKVNQFGYIALNIGWLKWWWLHDPNMQVKHIRLMRVFGCYGKLPVSLGQINFGQVFRLVETSEEVLLIGDWFSIKFRNALQFSLFGTGCKAYDYHLFLRRCPQARHWWNSKVPIFSSVSTSWLPISCIRCNTSAEMHLPILRSWECMVDL